MPKVTAKSLLKRKRNDSTEPSALVLCDRSPVYFISSIHDPRKSTTVSRRNKDGSVCVVFLSSACRRLHHIHGWMRQQ